MRRAVSAGLLALGVYALVAALAWSGSPFPGFFLLPNRVVASIGLPGWAGVADGRPLYQAVLLEVDGVPVTDTGVLRGPQAAPRDGSTARYLFARDGVLDERRLPVRPLSPLAFAAIFGTYALTGLAFLGLGARAAERWNDGELFRALAAFGWVTAAFAFTGLELYGPGHFFRVHALAEALLAATGAHLALACPRDLLRARPRLLGLVYGTGVALAAVYQIFLYTPAAYTVVHNFCQGVAALPAFALAARLALATDGVQSDLGPTHIRRLLAGTLMGMVAPALVFGLSSAVGGLLPVNAVSWCTFLFALVSLHLLGGLPRPARGGRAPAMADAA